MPTESRPMVFASFTRRGFLLSSILNLDDFSDCGCILGLFPSVSETQIMSEPIIIMNSGNYQIILKKLSTRLMNIVYVIEKSSFRALKWSKNHQNPIHIEHFTTYSQFFIHYMGMVIIWLNERLIILVYTYWMLITFVSFSCAIEAL